MNFISILIFSDTSLGYDKNKFTFPVDINQKYPNNGSGLCNQLFRFINALNFLDPTNNNIFFDFFSKDYLSGDMCKISEIIDIDEMNQKFNWNLKDVTDFRNDDFINQNFRLHNDHYVFRSYHSGHQSFEFFSRSIIWKKKYSDIADKVILSKIKEESTVNLVHLRIDQDAKKHILGHREPDGDYSSEYWKNREKAYEDLLYSYENAIYKNCDISKPLVLLLEDISHPLVKKLQNDFEVIFFEKELVDKIAMGISGREFYALIDLLIGTKLKIDTYIGLENSTPLADGNKHASSFSILLKHIADYKKCIMV